MQCPNINSPEWKSLVDKIGENNAWREFLVRGEIPSADNYDVLEDNDTSKKDVLYSIKTKSVEEIAKGVNIDIITTQDQIKYAGFIKSMFLNYLGDLAPGKKLDKSPQEAFEYVKEQFVEIQNTLSDLVTTHLTSEDKFNKIKNSSLWEAMTEEFLLLNGIKNYEELLKAEYTYQNVINDFKKYEDLVKVDLVSNGIRITKNKFQTVDPEDVYNKEEDETSDDDSISQAEVGERYDKNIMETNPRDTASIRVKALIQTIKTGEYELGVPIYADPNDVFADILDTGVEMALSQFTSNNSKLDEFLSILKSKMLVRPYLKDLVAKIEDLRKDNNWSKINDILTVATKAYAVETLLLYTLRRSGSTVNNVTDIKIISTNRDTIDQQISKEWLVKHLQSGFYDRSAQGDLLPKTDKIEKLNTIIEEGKNQSDAVQVTKFKEFFEVLGINFTDKEVEYMRVNLPKKLGMKNFGLLFANNNLLKNIYDSFLANKNEPFIGQYGFNNESRSMKQMAKLYYELNPGAYKIGSTKTADNKSKFAYIQPNYVEQQKREWAKGKTSSLFNSAFAKPNSENDNSFWKKVLYGTNTFELGYFSGIREQEAGQNGKVRKSLTPKEQIVTMFMKHQANANVGSYIGFTLSDKTTTMESKMTKEFFVDREANKVGHQIDYVFEEGKIVFTDALKRKVVNSFVSPEISRILASIHNKKEVNLENYNLSSKLFYILPNLNRDERLADFRNDLYSGEFDLAQLQSKYYNVIADVVLEEMSKSADREVKQLIELGVITVKEDKSKNLNYSFPLFKNIDYVSKFKSLNTSGANISKLMVLDLKLNYLNAQVKTIQFLKFDPASAFKTSIKGLDNKSISDIDGKTRVEMANSTWDEFSKRVAALIAPGSQGSWYWDLENKKPYTKAGEDYITVTVKDVKREIKNTDGNVINESETTDAEEFVTLQEHIDYLMSEGKIDYKIWTSIYNKIEKAGPGGFYTLTKKELAAALSPTKPVHVNTMPIGAENSGLNRIDYVKSSRYPLIPQHEAGSERDKLRIWMEKNNVRSVNFGSGKKLGKPTKSIVVFDDDNNFVEPTAEDFEASKQLLSRDGLKNQQEIPDQKIEISTVTQMNRTLFDGLLETTDFTFGNMTQVSGSQGKELKEKVRSRLFDIKANELRNKLGDLNNDHRKLYELLKDVIINDTTGSYTQNDLLALRIDPATNKFAIPLEAQWKLPKFQSLINSLINKNVMLKVEGTSFVQVSGVGAKYTFSDLSKGVKSDIIWIDKHKDQFDEKGSTLKYIRQENGVTKAAQVIVSQYLRDENGELIDLSEFVTEDQYGRKILDTTNFTEKMFQLIGTRIPNQSHPSTLPIEVVGFLPSYMENTIIVPDGITGQMGSDFDVDKLYAYITKFSYKKKGIKKRLGADEAEYEQLVNDAIKLAKKAKAKPDQDGRYEDFNKKYLSQAVKNKYGESEPPTHEITIPASLKSVEYELNSLDDVDNFTEEQLGQLYRDIHWEVLMHKNTFSKITKSVDMPEAKTMVNKRKEMLKKYELKDDDDVNLPLDYMTSIRRFIDNRSGKIGVGVFANLISAQADFQDKIISLSSKETGPDPFYIKLTKKGASIALVNIGKLGESTSFINEKRSISDNLNIMFTESVDNAKNQLLSEFNWDDKAMSAVGALAMLTTDNGESAPIDYMMNLTSQPSIVHMFSLIEQKQDSFGAYDFDAINSSATEIQNGIVNKIDKYNLLPAVETAASYFEEKNKKQDTIVDGESLQESWLIGKAVQQGAIDEYFKIANSENAKLDGSTVLEKIAKDFKYKTVEEMLLNYYVTQYNSIDSFIRLEGIGRELMTIIGAVYPYTKGIGPNLFAAKQKTNQLNKLAYSPYFTNLDNITGEINKLDNGDISISPKGEIGSAIYNSLIFAQDEVYKIMFPISSGRELEDTVDTIVDFLGLDKANLSKNKYETFYNNVFKATISYLYTNPSFELFDSSILERDRLINGESSLGARIIKLKNDPQYAKNGFLKNIEVKKGFNNEIYSLSFKSPFGQDINDKEVTSGFYELVIDDDNEIKQLAKDLAIYPFLTGDGGFLGRYIPVTYYTEDADFKRAMSNFQRMYVEHINTEGSRRILIDQLVQNNPEEYSTKFTFGTYHGERGTSYSQFKKVLKEITNTNTLEDVNSFTLKLGDFPDDDKNKSIRKSLKVNLTQNEITYLQAHPELAQVDFKYPRYLFITDEEVNNIMDVKGRATVKYLYKRTSDTFTVDGNASYERIEVLGYDNISEYDFNNSELTSVIPLNNVNRDDNEGPSPDILNQGPVTPNKPQGPTNGNNPADYTNHSGGAYGGDTFWDIIGRTFGVTNHKHYKDAGNLNISKQLKNAGVKATVLTKKQMDFAREKVKEILGIEYKDDLEGNLQVRNFYQVYNADAVYAIAKISPTTSPKVLGGTNTAVQLGIKMNKPVYVWDIDTEKWYTQDLEFLKTGFDNTKHEFDYNGWKEIDTPILTKNFAGVGSRDIEDYFVKVDGKWEKRKKYVGKEKEEKAKQAIKDVYEKTFKSTQPSTNTFKGKMTFSYGKNKRSDVKSETTFDAVLNGERTATTRYESQGNIEYWKNAKVGDIITWEDNIGRTVKVQVTKALHKLKGSGKTPEQWSKLEGWSVDYFNDVVKPKLNEAWQIEYKLIETPSSENVNEQSIISPSVLETVNDIKINPFEKSQVQEKVYHVDVRKDLNETTLLDDNSRVFPSGAFFTNNLEYAKKYANDINGVIYEAYINAEKPVNADKEAIQNYGRRTDRFNEEFSKNDSLIHESYDDKADIYGIVGKEIVVFKPDQIKLIGINNETININEPEVKTTVIEYGGKNFIVEGTEEDGRQIYYEAKGGKGKPVNDSALLRKIYTTIEVKEHPERIVTLTNIQNQPKYLVDFEGAVIKLQGDDFGKPVVSPSVIKSVLELFNNKQEIVTPTEITEEVVTEEPEIKTSNKKKINVPEGSNPNNMPIMETEDTIYLMNDGQQEAFNFIRDKVKELLKTRPKVDISDLDDTKLFTDDLTDKFKGLIPLSMWNNMIGLAGRGGVGKTTLIKAVINSITSENKYTQPSVMFLTPSHTAATVLQESLGLDSEKANDGLVNTIAAHLRKRPLPGSDTFGLINESDYLATTIKKPSFGQPDIIIIDEGSMIAARDIKDMITRINTDLKKGLISKMPVFIFMGDYRQLGPINEQQNKFVNKGPISASLFLDKTKTKELKQVMRSDSKLLHEIFDSVGKEIVSNMEKTKNGQQPVLPSFAKYDSLTKKSSDNILVVKGENGVIDDYTTYLINNNNPYGMFWIHYNNVDNPKTKNLANKIRTAYFDKIGEKPSEEKYRLYSKYDYIEYIDGVEMDTDKSYYYKPDDKKIIQILENGRYLKTDQDVYYIEKGVIKPNARFKVIDIKVAQKYLQEFLHPTIIPYLPKDYKIDVETSILYNRQNKIRAYSKILNLEVGPFNKGTYGVYNKATKKQEGIYIKNTLTGEIIATFDLRYSDYLDVKNNLDKLNTSKYTMPFVPAYIGSSHTAQGNSIKNVIVGDYNIKQALSNGETHVDDVFSSMYVALTRTSGTLTIIKPAGANIIDNQEDFLGILDDKNNRDRVSAGSQNTSLIDEIEEEKQEETIDFMAMRNAANFKDDLAQQLDNIFGKERNTDPKFVLNRMYLADSTKPLYRLILQAISKSGGLGGLRIEIDETLQDPGSYNRAEKLIKINPKLAVETTPDSIDAIADVLMHELLHHVTANIIETDKSKLSPDMRKWVMALENLFKHAQEKVMKDPEHAAKLQKAMDAVNKEGGYLSVNEKSYYYGLTNIHEFISMIMSDQKFRSFMNHISYTGEKSLLQRFLDIFTEILKVLGVNVKDNSVLKEAVTDILGIIESRDKGDVLTDDTTMKSIKTDTFLNNMLESEFDNIIKHLDIKTTNCK